MHPSVEDQRGGCVVAYPYHLGAALQEGQDPVAEVVFSPRVLSLVMSFVDTMVLNAMVLNAENTENTECWGGMRIGVGLGFEVLMVFM